MVIQQNAFQVHTIQEGNNWHYMSWLGREECSWGSQQAALLLASWLMEAPGNGQSPAPPRPRLAALLSSDRIYRTSRNPQVSQWWMEEGLSRVCVWVPLRPWKMTLSPRMPKDQMHKVLGPVCCSVLRGWSVSTQNHFTWVTGRSAFRIRSSGLGNNAKGRGRL